MTAIYKYKQAMRWFTRPKEDPSIKQLVAGRPSGAYGIQDTYSAPDDTPIPNWRDLIREEGVQVGSQVKAPVYDTRKYFKPGGLVEPGVTHYATDEKLFTLKKEKIPGTKNYRVVDIIANTPEAQTNLDNFIEEYRLSKEYAKTSTAADRAGVKRTRALYDKYFKDHYTWKTYNQNILSAVKKKYNIPDNPIIRDNPEKLKKYNADVDEKIARKLQKRYEQDPFKLKQKARKIVGRAGDLNVGMHHGFGLDSPETLSSLIADESFAGSTGITRNTMVEKALRDFEKQIDELKLNKPAGWQRKSDELIAKLNRLKKGKEVNYQYTSSKGNTINTKVKFTPEQLGFYGFKADTSTGFKGLDKSKTVAFKAGVSDELANKPLSQLNKAEQKKAINALAKVLEQGPEGIKFLNKQATAQTMWKIIGDKGGKICSTGLVNKAGGGRIGFAEKKCGLAFATEKPTEYMAAVKKNKEALNAFKAASIGKDTSKVLKAARWVMRDLGNPVGWIGSELILSGGITAAMLGEGYTTRESIDQGLAWFLPKSVLKAELHKIRDMAEKEGVDFETLMPFLELESIAEEHEKHQIQHEKLTNPLAAWKPEQLEYFSSKMFGKSTSELSDKEAIDFVNSLKMPSASGRGGEFYRKQAIDSSVLGMGTANKKYSDLLRKIQKPFGKDDLRYALPYSQLDELRNIADMSQTEKAKANELAALKSQYDRGMQYTRGQGKQTSFQDWVHQQGKGDLLFNEFQRGPDRREMSTWGLFHDVGKEPYKMPFPEKAPIDFSAAPYEAGGRVGFKLGGIDKGRRAFMKWLAGITGAGVAAGTGLLKWGKVAGKGKTAIKAGDTIVQGTKGMPDWYIPLINRIVKEGDDVTKKLGTVEREIVHTKKIAPGEEVTVYQNLDTGNVRVDYTSPHNMGEGAVGPVSLEYRAGEVITEGKHAGKKTKPEFEAVEPEPVSHTMGPDDYAIEWDGANVVGRAEDLMSDTNKLKQFATKKKPTMGEIVESSKKKKAVQKVHENESDYIATKQGEGEWDDYLPDIDDMDY